MLYKISLRSESPPHRETEFSVAVLDFAHGDVQAVPAPVSVKIEENRFNPARNQTGVYSHVLTPPSCRPCAGNLPTSRTFAIEGLRTLNGRRRRSRTT